MVDADAVLVVRFPELHGIVLDSGRGAERNVLGTIGGRVGRHVDLYVNITIVLPDR